MRTILAGVFALAAAWAPAAAAAPEPAYFEITPCRVLGADEAPVADGQPRLLPVRADLCPVSPDASAVLVKVFAVDASMPVRLELVPGSRNAVAPTAIEARPGIDGSGTAVVPLGGELHGLLGVQASFAQSGGSVGVGLEVVGYFEEAATFDGTTGFITTRPTCVPPKYRPDALNYLQGPEPIRLANGDVSILVGTGRCCLGTRHWEALYSLTYPAAGRAATPRFRPIWATNDFSRQPNRKEAEIGFPSAVRYGGKWRIALATAFLPFHKPNRDRATRIDLDDLLTRVKPSQVTNTWVKPIDPACRTVGSCPGSGSGLDPVLTLHPNGDLFLYHKDGNYPACTSGYLRHRVAPDLSVAATGHDGCVRFEGLAKAPFLISDIGRTADGRMLLLVEKWEGRGYIAEWESTGTPATIGLLWRPSGRVWPAPRHASPAPWGYYVRDAAFLKDDSRTILEPNVVVAQISDGRSFEELVDVELGRWVLYYWADTGAALPPTFGGPASSCGLQGVFEAADCAQVRGWAWDPTFPTTPLSVEILANNVVVATVPANELRADLAAAGRGDGRHGFTWTVPPELKNGRQQKLVVRFAESPDNLSGRRRTINCRL